MANFVRKRKALAPSGTILANRNDRGVVAPDDPRLATFQPSETHTRASIEGNSLKVDLVRFRDPQFLKVPLGRSETRHD